MIPSRDDIALPIKCPKCGNDVNPPANSREHSKWGFCECPTCRLILMYNYQQCKYADPFCWRSFAISDDDARTILMYLAERLKVKICQAGKNVES